MIDLKQLRENPDRFRQAARDKNMEVDVDRLVLLDERRRALLTEQESSKAEQNRLSKQISPQIGKLKGQLKSTEGPAKLALEQEIRELEHKPALLKNQVQSLEKQVVDLEAEWRDPLAQRAAAPRGQRSQRQRRRMTTFRFERGIQRLPAVSTPQNPSNPTGDFSPAITSNSSDCSSSPILNEA